MPFRSYIICALLQEPIKPNNPGVFTALKLAENHIFSDLLQIFICYMAFNPLSCNSFISCHDAIEICLISETHCFLFDTRVASVILHSNTELAVVLEMPPRFTNSQRGALV